MSAIDENAGSNRLEVDRVTVRYGDHVAVDAVSLVVEPGEIVAVVGPSGSGKSTLLRAVAGLVEPVSGSIVLGGRNLAGVPTYRRGIGLMFQNNALFPHLSVADNVAYGLRMAGWSSGRLRSRVEELLDLVGLSSYGDRSVRALSGGEAQRVALARALAPEPRLLMLDEPLGSLDRALREQLTRELQVLLNELGQSALHVTHDQGEAFTLADRVAVMMDGRLVQIGPPQQIWGQPATVAVARFVGHENVRVVSVVGTDTGSVLVDGGVALGPAPIGVDGPTTPGSYRAVIPAAAIAVSPGGWKAVVESVSFDRGRFEIDAVPTDAVLTDAVPTDAVPTDAVPAGSAGVDPATVGGVAGGGQGDGVVRFETDRVLRVGQVVELSVDTSAIMLFPI